MREQVSAVYKTDEYNAFNLLLGNRAVDRRRVEKVKSSINEASCLYRILVDAYECLGPGPITFNEICFLFGVDPELAMEGE